MLKIGEKEFQLNEDETSFYGWLDRDPSEQGRTPRLTWNLYISAQVLELDVRDLLPHESDLKLDPPVRELSPILDFCGIEISANDWKDIVGFSTEDCASFSFYIIGEFDHLSIEACSLSFLKREGPLFTVEFSGKGGREDCGIDFPFCGLLDVPFHGVGMEFLLSEKDPVEIGQRLLKRHLPNCSYSNYELTRVPKNAPPEIARQNLVFLPGS